ncbi:MAG: S1 family peptidase [Chloroflexota bacterium]|nr:S1 family peptidase [Chloroflexota bacterium]
MPALRVPRRLAVALFALLALMVAPAAAITDGVPDGNAHPHVGLVAFFDADGVVTHRCSGTLLSPTVFLTAGHCTDGAASARVWFDSYVVPSETGYPYFGGVTGRPFTHPNFVWSIPETSDVGVVVLDEEVYPGVYGVLPDLGTLDALATGRARNQTTFTVVGYGLQEVVPNFQADRERYQSSVKLVELQSALTDGSNIHVTNAPGTGGGLCFGDSDGPAFLNDSNVVVGVSSFVLNSYCKGAAYSYRTDIANAQNFVAQFMQ